MSLALVTPSAATRTTAVPRGDLVHRILLGLGVLAAASLVVYMAVYGVSYYRLSLEERPLSPLHAQLRSSGTIGLKLGILSLGMFCILFLYPLRKRWKWLARIGKTRNWLDVHVVMGTAAPDLLVSVPGMVGVIASPSAAVFQTTGWQVFKIRSKIPLSSGGWDGTVRRWPCS